MYLSEFRMRAHPRDRGTDGNESLLRFGAPQEKFHCVSYSFGEFVRPGEVNGPLTDDSIEKTFHEFRKMDHRKIAGDLAVLLAFGDDFAQQADGRRLGPAQLR